MNDLQMRCSAKPKRPAAAQRRPDGVDGRDGRDEGGDVRMSGIHAIAKLLHGKKESEAFEPEAIIRCCDMGTESVAAFVSHNMVEFYTDSRELSVGLDSLSVSDIFLARSHAHVSIFMLLCPPF